MTLFEASLVSTEAWQIVYYIDLPYISVAFSKTSYYVWNILLQFTNVHFLLVGTINLHAVF